MKSMHSGESEGFSIIFKEWYRPVFHFALSILKSKEEAEDISDECFIKLWERRKQFTTLARCKSYLYACVRNGSVDVIRRRKIVVASGKEILYLNGSGEDSLFEKLCKIELAKQIRSAVSMLPPGCRKIITLTFIEGKTSHEAAKTLNLSANTIKNQKQRGLAILRSRFIPLLVFAISLIY